MPKDHGFAFHPIALIFPLLEGDELEALAENIRANGLWESAWLYEGKVLDGRNRATACKLAGVTLKTREFKGDRLAALRFVWSENFHRRHLNPSQAAVAEAKRGKLGAEYGAEVEKMKEAQPKGGRPKKGEKPRQQIAEVSPDERKTSDRRAKSVGSNRRYLEAAEKLLEESPEKLVPVEKGEKTLSQVLREEKREQVQAKLAAFPSDKYRVIYADPPWSYGNSGAVSDHDAYSRTARHYPAMTIAELCALDIKSIIAKDAVLFLWVTSPLLAECFPVIKAWGFEYKSSFIWDKVKHNFGHYNSVRHEFLLVCTRGSCTPDAKKLHDSVVSIERTAKHSEKPEEFRKMIDGLYKHGKRIELFARAEAKGWDRWGAEA
uniref:Putative methyltransferase n=1 Tax=viral metagenome TaxID=1070528 RepID=A0A6H1ZXN7_9ZZZZ